MTAKDLLWQQNLCSVTSCFCSSNNSDTVRHLLFSGSCRAVFSSHPRLFKIFIHHINYSVLWTGHMTAGWSSMCQVTWASAAFKFVRYIFNQDLSKYIIRTDNLLFNDLGCDWEKSAAKTTWGQNESRVLLLRCNSHRRKKQKVAFTRCQGKYKNKKLSIQSCQK